MFWIAGLFFVFLLGIPIAFSLGAVTLGGLISAGLPLEVVVQRMFTGVDNFSLVAIPLFVLAGNLMAVGGISRRITNFAEAMVGHWPGGLGMVVIVAAMIFAAVTGSAIAAAAAIGGILISEMMEKGYSREYSAALVACAGTIGPIIPPSIPLVVYGVMVGSSIARLFMAGVVPGLIMGLMLMLFNYWISRSRGYIGRPKKASWGEIARGFQDAVLALLMPLIIIGGIVLGVFTPTESAGIAVAYALLLGSLVYRELTWKGVIDSFRDAAISSGVILTVLMTASLFIWFLTVKMLPQQITTLLLGVVHSKWVGLLIMNIILLIAGTFIDTISALTIFVPLFLPLVKALNIDLVHFGMIVAMNLTIGMVTPPLGVCLFVSCGIAKTGMREIMKDLLILLIPLMVTLALVTYIPALSLWFPNMLGLK